MIGNRTPEGWKRYFDENDGDLFPSDREALLQDYLAAKATCQFLLEQSNRWEALALENAAALGVARNNCAELEALFAFQRTRMAEATRAWQMATGKQDVLPDLGDLLAWLMDRSAALEADNQRLREMLKDEHESRQMAFGGHKYRDQCPVCAALAPQAGEQAPAEAQEVKP